MKSHSAGTMFATLHTKGIGSTNTNTQGAGVSTEILLTDNSYMTGSSYPQRSTKPTRNEI